MGSSNSTCTRPSTTAAVKWIMEDQDSWWDFDSGISSEWSEEDNGETSTPAKPRYVPSIISDVETDYGLVIGTTLAILCVILVLLAAVGLVIYSKIVQQKRRQLALEKASAERQ